MGRMLAGMHRAGAPHVGSLPAPGRFFVGRCELDSPADETDERHLAPIIPDHHS